MAWKFRVLEAESILWQGLYEDVPNLLTSPRTPPRDPDIAISMLAVGGIADAYRQDFASAERELKDAGNLCLSPLPRCGQVLQARGILADQRGDHSRAEEYFRQTLGFARAHSDPFLEASALLNLGDMALAERRFDEAIDRSEAAYQSALKIDAPILEIVAQGNIGWAYYNLGDSQKAFELSTEAEKRAANLDDVSDQENLLTNIGYIYMDQRRYSEASRSFEQALVISSRTKGKEDAYNALRVLARLALRMNDPDKASRLAEQALGIARGSEKSGNELYPTLIEGQVAGLRGNIGESEAKLRFVERFPKCPAVLKWEAEHSLAQLYEIENLSTAADREYRAALATFEASRHSVQHEDLRVAFLTNAASIYDDYIRFLIAKGRESDALRWAEYSRARTLAEGLGMLQKKVSAGPALNAQETARKVGGALLFYWLGEKQSYLWAITSRKTALFTLAPGSEIDAAVLRYRRTIARSGPDVLDSADEDGRLLYRILITPAQSLLEKEKKVFILPDGKLNNLNFETLLAPGPKLHYWIDDVTIANASSLRMLDASVAGTHSGRPKRSLLLMGSSLPPNDKYPVLPKAQAQMDAVAKHFLDVERNILTGAEATPLAYLNGRPEHYSYIHFVDHGIASEASPLDSAIVLSKSTADSDSFKLYARDILQHPLQAELVTVAACYGAQGNTYSGEGLVGLSWAFLRAGSHNVIAALWEVTDAPSPQMMDDFYGGIERGEAPDRALRAAKLAMLHQTKYRNPYYWAPLQLYVGARMQAAHPSN